MAQTIYRNAQNPALMGEPFPNEEHPRGVVTVANQSTIAQVTLHLDHAFWESFVHDSPAHFDQFAARYAGMTTVPMATMEDFKGFALRPFIGAQAHEVPWRSIPTVDVYTAPGGLRRWASTRSRSRSIRDGQCTAASCNVIRDFYDYTLYNHSTFGHLNADGLSFVDRQYPSPK